MKNHPIEGYMPSQYKNPIKVEAGRLGGNATAAEMISAKQQEGKP